MRLARASRRLLGLTLVPLAVLLAGCGSSGKGLIPMANAGPLVERLAGLIAADWLS